MSPPSHAPAVNPVVGRALERQQVEEFIASIDQGAAATIIWGDAGIGKTTLWRHAVSAADRLDVTVLTARASEDESTGILVGLYDLFETTDLDMKAVTESDPMVRGRVVLDVLRTLAAERSVLVAVDDAQWLDPSTARALRYALRRLDSDPVGVLATVRTEQEAEDTLALVKSLPPGRVASLRLGPLEVGDLREMIGPVTPKASPVTMSKIAEVSGGNPLYALELARALPSDLEVGETIPLPTSLRGAVEQRLGTVPPTLTPLLEMVSATGPVTTDQLRRYLPETDVESLLPQANELGLLAVENDLRVRFAHPLLAAAVYGGLDTLTRRSLHAGIVELESDAGMRNWHLALSADTPDKEIADRLEESAELAQERGANDLAAFYSRHSARLTPSEDTQSTHRRRLLEVSNLAAAGQVTRARSLIDELVASLPPGPDRAEMLVQRFYVENDDVEVGEATLASALEDSRSDPALTGRVLDILGWHRGVFRGDLDAGIETALRAVEIAEELEDGDLWLIAAGHLAHMKCMAGEPDDEMAIRAVSMAEERGGPPLGGGPRAWRAKQVFWAGSAAHARAEFHQLVSTGNEIEKSYRYYDLSLVACSMGELEEAYELAVRGVYSAQDTDNTDSEGWMQYPLALAQAWLGDSDQAESTARGLLSWPGRPGNMMGIARARSVLGLIAMSGGDRGKAVDEFGTALGIADRVGLGNPGVVPVLPDLVIALALEGRTDRALSFLPALERQAESLNSPRTWALFEHASGVTSLAIGRTGPAINALDRSIARFQNLGLIPDMARAVLGRGRARARAGFRSQAIADLTEAARLFSAMGATRWATQAEREIARVGPARAEGPLTATESQIAGLVTDGRKNKEIAAELFVSVATVEAHLTRVYRKLGISSRAELARLVADGTLAIPLTE